MLLIIVHRSRWLGAHDLISTNIESVILKFALHNLTPFYTLVYWSGLMRATFFINHVLNENFVCHLRWIYIYLTPMLTPVPIFLANWKQSCLFRGYWSVKLQKRQISCKGEQKIPKRRWIVKIRSLWWHCHHIDLKYWFDDFVFDALPLFFTLLFRTFNVYFFSTF